jgi:hypothetical protein
LTSEDIDTERPDNVPAVKESEKNVEKVPIREGVEQ